MAQFIHGSEGAFFQEFRGFAVSMVEPLHNALEAHPGFHFVGLRESAAEIIKVLLERSPVRHEEAKFGCHGIASSAIGSLNSSKPPSGSMVIGKFPRRSRMAATLRTPGVVMAGARATGASRSNLIPQLAIRHKRRPRLTIWKVNSTQREGTR